MPHLARVAAGVLAAVALEIGKHTAVGGISGAAIGAVAGAVSGGGAGSSPTRASTMPAVPTPF